MISGDCLGEARMVGVASRNDDVDGSCSFFYRFHRMRAFTWN